MIGEVFVMKRTMRIILALLMLGVMMLGAITCEAAKKTVAVTAVENTIGGSYGRKAAQDLEAALTTILVQSGNYNVVERAQLEHVLRELNLHSTGLISGDTAIQFGNMVGADYTIVGNVTLAEFERFNNYLYKGHKAKVKFNFKFIDNKTGVIEIAEVVEGSDTVSEFENKNPDRDIMISNAASDVAKKVKGLIDGINPVTGLIVSVNDGQAYIDIGSNSGVHKGETLVIYKEGKVIKHPVTGKILTVEKEFLGALKLETVEPDYAVGKITKQKGNITVGCHVKRGK